MAKYQRFTFACDKQDRRMLSDIARRLERSQSDAVRLLIREAARELAQNTAVFEPVAPVATQKKEGVSDEHGR